MSPDGDPGGFWLLPFPLLLDVGVGIVDEPTDMSERLSCPIPQLFNPLGAVRRSGLAIRTTCRLHALSDLRFASRPYAEGYGYCSALPVICTFDRQAISSVHPSSANSTARSNASLAAKNSSSCGGGTEVPLSIPCACP